MQRAFAVVLLLTLVLSGCGDSDTNANTAVQPTEDAFKVPIGFHSSYTLQKDEDVSIGPNDTRRTVRIVVPVGLSDSELGNNMRAAAEQAYNADGSPHAIMVFAYKPGTPTDLEYTAGRLQWAPHGDWMQADQDVPVEEHQATMDVSDEYRPQPKSTTPKSAEDKKLDAALAKTYSSEKKREAKLNRRISETRRRHIYYDDQQAMLDAVMHPSVPGDVKASTDANIAEVRRKYGISSDDVDCIRTEGDTAGWPEPQ